MFDTMDVNCDIGEGYGNYTFGSDADIMPYLSSANVACGFHGGDPVGIERTIKLAKRHGVAIGAHWGLPDRVGFGRRRIEISPDDARCLTLYQIGALQGMATAQGMEIDHLVPHGALFAMLEERDDLAAAAAEAIQSFAADWVCYTPSSTKKNVFYDRLKAHGHKLVPEVVADLQYGPDGAVIMERTKQAVDLEAMGRRLESFLKTGRLKAVDGAELAFEARAVLFHGDGPNAVDVARTIRATLDRLGIRVMPASQLV